MQQFQLFKEMILEKLINHFMNQQQVLKRVDYNLLNIKPMVLLQHVQQIWEQEKDNQFQENSPISQNKELMKRNQKNLLNPWGFKQEVLVENILPWTRKEHTSPSARFGVTEAIVTKRLWEGLIKLYDLEKQAGQGGDRQNCCIIQ